MRYTKYWTLRGKSGSVTPRQVNMVESESGAYIGVTPRGCTWRAGFFLRDSSPRRRIVPLYGCKKLLLLLCLIEWRELAQLLIAQEEYGPGFVGPRQVVVIAKDKLPV